MPPPSKFTTIGVVLIALLIPPILNAQRKYPLGKDLQTPDNYRTGSISFRKSDNAIAGIYDGQERAEGKTFEEAALNYLDKNKIKFGFEGSIRNHLKHHFTYDGNDLVVVRFQQTYKGLSTSVPLACQGYKPCQEQGDLYVRLQNGLHTIWQNNGSEGEGFALQMDGRLKITGTSAVIEGLAMATGTPYYLTVEYSPGTNARPCICDVEQRDQQDYVVGGERFIYDPDYEESFSGGESERNQIKAKKTDHLHIYPVPTEDVLYVEFESAPEDLEAWLSVFDSRGVLQIQKNIATQHPNNILRLEVKQLPEGLYSLQIANTGRKSVKSIRFTKL